MSGLERDLRDLAERVEWPATPEIETVVHRRLLAPSAPLSRRRRRRRASVVVLAALLAFCGAALAASPGARDSILEWLGLRGVRVQRVPALPKVELGSGLDLGRRVTLEQARRRVRFAVVVPSLAGFKRPDEVFLSDELPGGQVSFVYGPRPGLPRATETGAGLVISQFAGRVPTRLIGKLAGPGTTVERVSVNGESGLWLSGAEHLAFYEDARRSFRRSKPRLAGNTLLWQRGPVTLRLEARVGNARALRIASSMF